MQSAVSPCYKGELCVSADTTFDVTDSNKPRVSMELLPLNNGADNLIRWNTNLSYTSKCK